MLITVNIQFICNTAFLKRIFLTYLISVHDLHRPLWSHRQKNNVDIRRSWWSESFLLFILFWSGLFQPFCLEGELVVRTMWDIDGENRRWARLVSIYVTNGGEDVII